MKFSKILFRIAAVLIVLFLAAGTAAAVGQKENKDSGQIVIAVCMQGNQNGFVAYQVAAMREYLINNNIKNEKLDVVFADDDPVKQQNQVEDFVARGADCIIVGPVDMVQSVTAIDYAIDKGVPVITVANRSGSKKVTGHAGSNDLSAGRMQMERLVKLGAKNVAYITAVLGHSVQISREQGYKDVLAEHPEVKLIVQNTADWSGEKALQLTENWLQRYPGQIDAIAANADCIIIGSVIALENAGQGGKVLLSGVDGDMPVLEKIKAGTCDNTLWKDGLGEGEWALRLAIDAAQGKPIKDVDIPFAYVTKDNVDEFIQKSHERNALSAKYF